MAIFLILHENNKRGSSVKLEIYLNQTSFRKFRKTNSQEKIPKKKNYQSQIPTKMLYEKNKNKGQNNIPIDNKRMPEIHAQKTCQIYNLLFQNNI